MYKGFQTELVLNNVEASYCAQHAGTARHAWNWGLGLTIEKLREGEHVPTAIDLHKLLVRDVKTENEWYYDVSKCSPQQALRDLKQAFKRFWKQEHPKNLKRPFNERYHKRLLKQYKKGEIKTLGFEHEKGFPQFKKKNVNDAFYLEGKILVEGNKIKLPKFGWIKTYERCTNRELKNVRITRRAGRWFIAYKYECEEIKYTNRKPNVGADVGIKTLATLSDGTTFENPKDTNQLWFVQEICQDSFVHSCDLSIGHSRMFYAQEGYCINFQNG